MNVAWGNCRKVVGLLVGVASLAVPLAANDGKSVRVYVFARPQESLDETAKKAREKETDAERKRLGQARKDLDKSLEAKHGKRGKEWPEEARLQSDEAWRAELRAEMVYRQVGSKDLAGLTKSLANTLRHDIKKTPQLTLADAADQADLIVEVLAHGAKSSFPAAAWMLYLEIKPVGGTADARFVGTGLEQAQTKKLGIGLASNADIVGFVSTMHPYTEAEPYWRVRVWQQGTGYGSVLSTASEVLVAFASDLAGPAQQEAKR